MKNIGNTSKIICDFQNSQEFQFLVPKSQRWIFVGNLETIVRSACSKYYLFLICNVIGTEIEDKCLETVMVI